MTLAERLTEFAAGLEFDDLPADVVASVRLRTLDILGIALASSTSELAPSVLGALQGWGSGACSVVGSRLTASPPLAALANGALAHGLDFDDTHAVSITHASAVVLPTVLALGEASGHDGRALVTAAVAGYEAMTRLGMAAPGEFHAHGWHATAVCGTFAAALAAGRLERLDRARLTAALGIAGSFASGVIEHLEDGSWVKRVHPGWAAHSGVVAAGLARRVLRARHDSRGPLRLLSYVSPLGARPDAIRHAREGVGDAPHRVQAVPVLPLQPRVSRLRARASPRAPDRA